MTMRSLRGLRVIRSGGLVLHTPPTTRADDDGEGITQGAPATDGRLATLEVDFSEFDRWYEIDSWWEGRFLERVRPGAFKRTIARNGNNVKIFFNHGYDPSIGSKVLGVPELLEERPTSPHLEAGLLDTSYNRDLLPALRAGAYGSSFMFEVTSESWDHDPEASDYNPNALPERSITELGLFEAGPVTWPANDGATAGVRSGTDWLIEQLQERDASAADDLLRSLAGFRGMHDLRSSRLDEGHATAAATEPATTAAPDADEASPRSARARYLQAKARGALGRNRS